MLAAGRLVGRTELLEQRLGVFQGLVVAAHGEPGQKIGQLLQTASQVSLQIPAGTGVLVLASVEP